MSIVASFAFNPFQENTFVVYDETKECVIFDPGCNDQNEEETLANFIKENGLKPVRLINTHCHLDHVFGNKFVSEKYDLPLEIHEDEVPMLAAMPQICRMYGMPVPEDTLNAGKFIADGDIIRFGNTELLSIFTPGHSPGELCFYCKKDKYLIAGDVLFHGSIGRTDLPGGDHGTLLESIKTRLFPLDDDVKVYPGHGPATSIGFERKNNPFLN